MALTDSLEAFWKLDETSGTRSDSEGSNDLTDNNTVLSRTGIISNAGDFVSANSEYLSIADNASLSMGDIDFTLACWAYLDDKSATHIFFGKRAPAPDREYALHYNSGLDVMRFLVSNDGTAQTILQADNFGSPAINTWMFIVAWHDASANTLNIQVNDGTADSVSYSTGVHDATAEFRLGRQDSGQNHDGGLDMAAVWKKVLTSQEKTDLFNLAHGLDHPFTGTIHAPTITRVGSETINNSSSDVSSHSYSHTTTAATDLLLLVVHIEGAESVSGTPTFDGDDFTLIRDTGDTSSNTDVRSYIYGQVSPTVTTGTVAISFTTIVNPSASICVNYTNTDTTDVATATNFLTDDVNTSATSTNVHASGGTAGNCLFITVAGQGADTQPMGYSDKFVRIWDDETGTSSTVDFGHGGAEANVTVPSAVTATLQVSDENTGILIELVREPGHVPYRYPYHKQLRTLLAR